MTPLSGVKPPTSRQGAPPRHATCKAVYNPRLDNLERPEVILPRCGVLTAPNRKARENSPPSFSSRRTACSRSLSSLLFSTPPWANELDLARAGVDLPLLDLPELFLAHSLHLVRLRYLSTTKKGQTYFHVQHMSSSSSDEQSTSIQAKLL